MESFGSIMNIPSCLSETSFVNNMKVLRKAAERECEKSMVAAVDEVLPYYERMRLVSAGTVHGENGVCLVSDIHCFRKDNLRRSEVQLLSCV